MTLVFKPWHSPKCIVQWPIEVGEEIRVNSYDDLLKLTKFKFIFERPDFHRFSKSVGSLKDHCTLLAELRGGFNWHVLGFIQHACGAAVKEVPQWRPRIKDA